MPHLDPHPQIYRQPNASWTQGHSVLCPRGKHLKPSPFQGRWGWPPSKPLLKAFSIHGVNSSNTEGTISQPKGGGRGRGPNSTANRTAQSCSHPGREEGALGLLGGALQLPRGQTPLSSQLRQQDRPARHSPPKKEAQSPTSRPTNNQPFPAPPVRRGYTLPQGERGHKVLQGEPREFPTTPKKRAQDWAGLLCSTLASQWGSWTGSPPPPASPPPSKLLARDKSDKTKAPWSSQHVCAPHTLLKEEEGSSLPAHA